MTYRIGFIGTGAPDGDGFAMAYRHAEGYRRLDDCEIVACADLVRENAEAFAEEHDVPDHRVYEDYEEMLSEAEPDVVSVCVPPADHADIVVGTARSGVVRAIHCEKPMALTWGDARRMVEVCDAEGVSLTINHQHRFGRPYTEPKRLLEKGKVGDLKRIEFREEDLYDNGTHAFDLANYYNDGTPVEWVLGQIDYTEENVLFGAHNENQAVAQWRYENGVYGIASTGRGEEFVGALFRLVGTDGVIEVGADGTVSYRRDGGKWKTVDTGSDARYRPKLSKPRLALRYLLGKASEGLAGRLDKPTYTARAIEDVIESIRTGERSELDARDALAADELIFATWESSRRRGRVDLPLEVDDNPLEAMVEAGVVGPDSDLPSRATRRADAASGSSGSLPSRLLGRLTRS
ncbi:Gfo/Idh/MocA family protein [Halopelagius longus]|uniref:Gfo/Idh/MocA family oxidoreductase n=1 Tax=Halopelagius longus TaxID=1236180 RepID=A0A1H1GNA6_9EURY|nr:Gfo/Idh/MocA family oxidoreductase [Halopelagius longus]RDI69642.1 gfo/Idh/MocA family oxidoreductase [Halopelagius longus]SDR14640.1 Predicted dehydrogenase [Halopelagius longus]